MLTYIASCLQLTTLFLVFVLQHSSCLSPSYEAIIARWYSACNSPALYWYVKFTPTCKLQSHHCYYICIYMYMLAKVWLWFCCVVHIYLQVMKQSSPDEIMLTSLALCWCAKFMPTSEAIIIMLINIMYACQSLVWVLCSSYLSLFESCVVHTYLRLGLV